MTVEMFTVIGCDPGKSFGLVLMRVSIFSSKFSGKKSAIDWRAHQLPDTHALAYVTDYIRASNEHCEATFTEPRTFYAAVESFTVLPGSGRRTGASKTGPLVGQIKALGSIFPNVTVYEQSVSDVTRGFPDRILKTLGLYVQPVDVGTLDANDANSAMRHCLYWLSQHRASVINNLVNDAQLL